MYEDSQDQHNCKQDCVNTEGSFVCMCRPGYKKYGDRCLDIDECLEQQQGLCPSPGTCKNTEGSFRCVCPRGYKLDQTGTFCIDNNECDDDARCEDGCENSLGSYKCGCPEVGNDILSSRCTALHCTGKTSKFSDSNSPNAKYHNLSDITEQLILL